MLFYAHSTSTPSRSDWQLLPVHLRNVGALAADLASHFGGQDLARIKGLLHDVGKYTEAFQRDRLCGKGPKIDHATWGAWIAIQRYGFLGWLMAYGIAGHHAGLSNGKGSGSKRGPLEDRLSERHRKEVLKPLLSDWEDDISLPEHVDLPAGFDVIPARKMFQYALLARMIFSCLVDADYIDTDNFYRMHEGRGLRVAGQGPSLESLRHKLDAYLSTLPKDRVIDHRRTSILEHVRGQASLSRGLFSLTVPTGGGKTLASMAFALDHAIQHGLRRVIYVIPYTSIIEQNAQVFRKAFGDLGDSAVLEHHSAFVENPKDERESIEKRHLAMENWDSPVVVTTAVQFFESLFSDRPSRCRKLHNIAESVVVLDEAQMLPVPLLRPCVTLINELALNYRTSLVLCTATQPALRADNGFKHGLVNVRELAPDPVCLHEEFRRVRVRHAGRLTDEDLADRMRSHEQVLCIVNNRRHAKYLFDAISKEEGARHLTTLMCGWHRSQVLDDARRDLSEGKPCRLVSTSLLEAGVDISLPTVFRAEAGLDSIAQAAGRCNRHGDRPADESEVVIFETDNALWSPPPELKEFAEVFREMHQRHANDLLSPHAIAAYFEGLYAHMGNKQLDKCGLLSLLERQRIDSLPLEDVAAAFRIIQSAMRPIIVPFVPGTNERIPELDVLFAEDNDGAKIARGLQPFTVQVPQSAYDELWKAHAIQPMAPYRFGDQFVQLINHNLYDKRSGLHWDNPQFLVSEQMVQ